MPAPTGPSSWSHMGSMTHMKCLLLGQMGTLDSPGLPGASAPASQKQGRGAAPTGWGGGHCGQRAPGAPAQRPPRASFPAGLSRNSRASLWTLWGAPLEQVSYRMPEEERTAAFVETAYGAFIPLSLILNVYDSCVCSPRSPLHTRSCRQTLRYVAGGIQPGFPWDAPCSDLGLQSSGVLLPAVWNLLTHGDPTGPPTSHSGAKGRTPGCLPLWGAW